VALWKAEELNEVLAPAGFETLGPEGQQEVLRLLDERWLPSPPAGPGLMDRVLLRRFASGQVDPHDAAAAAERWLVDPGGMSAEEVSERLLVGLELDAQRLVAWVSALADGEPVPELPVGWSRVLRQSDDVCDEVASGGCVAVMAGLARESQRWEMEGWQAWELELAEPPAEAALLVPVWAVRWPDERGRLAAAERFAGYQSWVSASSDPAEWNRRAEWASQRAHGLGASDPWRAAAALLALAERGGIVLALEEVEGGPRRVTVGSALDPIVPEALIRRLIDDIEATVL
jgi:hypothetical protein